MSVNFVTFGSHSNYIDAGKRLLEQAKNLNIFNKAILYTGDSIKTDMPFWEKHEKFINNNKRGYGYWLWKPYIIAQMMEQMNDGDILLYLDCGCEINVKEKDYLLEFIDKVKTDKILGSLTQLERNWNKMDLVEKLEMNKDIYLNTSQRAATGILFYVSNETRQFVNHWYELCCDYHNIDDTSSIHINLSCFIEHRHDQSVYSLLTKKYNLHSSLNLFTGCIKRMRNRSGISKLNV